MLWSGIHWPLENGWRGRLTNVLGVTIQMPCEISWRMFWEIVKAEVTMVVVVQSRGLRQSVG